MKRRMLKTVCLTVCISVSLCGCGGIGEPDKSAENQRQNSMLEPQPRYSLQSPVPEVSVPSASDYSSPDTEVLCRFETKLSEKDPDRTHNITVAAEKISGCVVQPGSIFSFNEVVGKRTPEANYKEAKIIVDGEYEEGFGGGICQLSSTLYNAAENAGLETTERHPHGKRVGYVPKGRDATVSYGTLDLKFKNTKSFPVEIRAGIENGKVYAAILKG